MSTAVANERIREIVANAFNFEVEKFPLCGPDREKTPHYGLFRTDNHQCVGNAVRQGYVPHTTDDVLALVEAASVGFNADCNVFTNFNGGHEVVIGPTEDYRRTVFGSHDAIWPRFILNAGYDGRAFTASLGLFRDACLNLVRIRSAGREHSVALRHSNNLREVFPSIVRDFRTLAASWDNVVETAQQLAGKQVKLATFIRNVYPLAENATERQVASFTSRAEAIVGRIVRERDILRQPQIDPSQGEDLLVNVWEALNAVQGYCQHEKTRRGELNDIQRAIIALRDQDVTRATQYALAL